MRIQENHEIRFQWTFTTINKWQQLAPTGFNNFTLLYWLVYMHAVKWRRYCRVFFFLGVQSLVTNCARNLAKSTTTYYVTVYGLENYIMAFIRLHFKKEILLSLLKSLQTKCHEITQDYNTQTWWWRRKWHLPSMNCTRACNDWWRGLTLSTPWIKHEHYVDMYDLIPALYLWKHKSII